MIRIGVIGYGLRMRGVTDLMQTLNEGTEIVAIADPGCQEIKSRMEGDGRDISGITFYASADDMLADKTLDAVMIGTRCSLHANLAEKVLSQNIPLFLEKPIATNMDDLVRLRNAAANSTGKTVVSFPLRVTPLVDLAKEIIQSGQIGTVEHVQAVNNVPYGGVYYHSWYRDENETGGLFLQKATHDFDYINYLLGIQPVSICAMKSKQIFKGDRPAGLKCKDCAEVKTCVDSPFNPSTTNLEVDAPDDRMCAFAVDTGNEDSGSALISYETGMHVSYTQNFFARNAAGKRGATLIGYKGTIEFDWYTNQLKVYMHHKPRTETHDLGEAGSHGGGDIVLMDNFIKVIKGECKSISPLSSGLISALMCLKAKESATTGTFQEVKFP